MVHFKVLDQRRALRVSRLNGAFKGNRTATVGQRHGAKKRSAYTGLVSASVYLTFPILCGLPNESRGGPMSNTARMFDMSSHRLSSMKKRPGQILRRLCIQYYPRERDLFYLTFFQSQKRSKLDHLCRAHSELGDYCPSAWPPFPGSAPD